MYSMKRLLTPLYTSQYILPTLLSLWVTWKVYYVINIDSLSTNLIFSLIT